MFEELLPPIPGEEKLPYDLLVERTEGYSGSDIRLLCKEAAMQPLRRLMAQLEDKAEVVPEEGENLLGVISTCNSEIHRHANYSSFLMSVILFFLHVKRKIGERKKKCTLRYTHMHAFKKPTPSYFCGSNLFLDASRFF